MNEPVDPAGGSPHAGTGATGDLRSRMDEYIEKVVLKYGEELAVTRAEPRDFDHASASSAAATGPTTVRTLPTTAWLKNIGQFVRR